MKNIPIFHLAAIGLFVFSSPASADQVILDDLIVDGSVCVGVDCVNGESFGFDTIRLKENNLRIRFVDTSSTSSFPSRDWQITVNDSSNGGLNKFSIDDIDGGRTPFTIEAGAPSHSLYVEDGGRVGFGTSTPVVDLHVKSGNTPTLRLEQDGSSGFTPQTWDLAGNEANFFIRDATNGSTLPFRIKPGAPSSSIFIASGGDVGLGTDSPAKELHILDTTDGATMQIESNGPAKISLKNTATSKEWKINSSNEGEFRITDEDPTDIELILTSAGDLTITGKLITEGPTCTQASGGCDYVFSPEYRLDSIEDHALKMWENSYLPAVGPTSSNVPINLTEKTGAILNELEKAHIYIEQLNNNMKFKNNEIFELKTRLAALEKSFKEIKTTNN